MAQDVKTYIDNLQPQYYNGSKPFVIGSILTIVLFPIGIIPAAITLAVIYKGLKNHNANLVQSFKEKVEADQKESKDEQDVKWENLSEAEITEITNALREGNKDAVREFLWRKMHGGESLKEDEIDTLDSEALKEKQEKLKSFETKYGLSEEQQGVKDKIDNRFQLIIKEKKKIAEKLKKKNAELKKQPLEEMENKINDLKDENAKREMKNFLRRIKEIKELPENAKKIKQLVALVKEMEKKCREVKEKTKIKKVMSAIQEKLDKIGASTENSPAAKIAQKLTCVKDVIIEKQSDLDVKRSLQFFNFYYTELFNEQKKEGAETSVKDKVKECVQEILKAHGNNLCEKIQQGLEGIKGLMPVAGIDKKLTCIKNAIIENKGVLDVRVSLMIFDFYYTELLNEQDRDQGKNLVKNKTVNCIQEILKAYQDELVKRDNGNAKVTLTKKFEDVFSEGIFKEIKAENIKYYNKNLCKEIALQIKKQKELCDKYFERLDVSHKEKLSAISEAGTIRAIGTLLKAWSKQRSDCKSDYSSELSESHKKELQEKLDSDSKEMQKAVFERLMEAKIDEKKDLRINNVTKKTEGFPNIVTAALWNYIQKNILKHFESIDDGTKNYFHALAPFLVMKHLDEIKFADLVFVDKAQAEFGVNFIKSNCILELSRKYLGAEPAKQGGQRVEVARNQEFDKLIYNNLLQNVVFNKFNDGKVKSAYPKSSDGFHLLETGALQQWFNSITNVMGLAEITVKTITDDKKE
jgi:hypothetical protein